MKSTFIPLFFNLMLFQLSTGKAQQILPATATMHSFGGMRATYPNDSFNPAHLTADSAIYLSLFHNNQFLRSGLSEKGILYRRPLLAGAGGALFTLSGFNSYAEWAFMGLYGRQLNQHLALGIGMGRKSIQLKGIQSTASPLISLGMDWIPIQQLGFSMEFQHSSQRTGLTAGFRFAPNLQTLVLAEVALFGYEEAQIRIGLEYQLHPILYFRTGISAPAMQIAFGGKLRLSQRQELNLAWMHHAYLGYSGAISLTFYLKNPSHAHSNRVSHQL